MRKRRVWIIRGAAAAVLAIALIYAFLPRPIPVDMATVSRAALEVSLRDDGYTRVREVYRLSAPLTGRVLRFNGEVGDSVVAGETVLASILPSDPAMLDVRTRTELEAAVRGAEANMSLAEAAVASAEAAVEYARTDFQRTEELTRRGAVSEAALDRARLELRTQQAALAQAQASLDVRGHELETARAALIGPGDAGESGDATSDCCVALRAPVSGRILQIYQESESVVAAGTPLVEIGDPHDLEIVADLLSTDAVQVNAGDPVVIERWGGEGNLNGTVDRVEPYGFTKVSSLGIEEQRVNVIIRLTDPPEIWERLGHGYRVEARVILWQGDDVLQVPLSALFSHGEGRAVFVVRGGRARLAPIEIGHRNSEAVEVVGGLEDGDRVIVHPSDRVTAGVLVEDRSNN
ncbi:MAG: HlyD family efflux transporter periplasmic adaptor subunit [Sphingomonadales bacterium]|nr:MAG: HlyD family efflux transporter periplasmic adaptor subunit [Sphingomonadales bacterium]